MNKYMSMVKREFWEHKNSFVLMPLVLAGILLLVQLMGTIIVVSYQDKVSLTSEFIDIKINLDDEDAGINTGDPVDAADTVKDVDAGAGADADLERRHIIIEFDEEDTDFIEIEALDEDEDFLGNYRAIVNFGFYAIHLLFMVLILLAAFFYALNTLYADRRDRSILFWKSLPISETENVLIKLLVAILAAPLLATVIAWGVQIIYLVFALVVVNAQGSDPWQTLLPNAQIFSAFTSQFLTVVFVALWCLPLAAWLLLASAWAKRSPLMVAFVPVVAIIALERIMFSSSYFSSMLAEYFHQAGTIFDVLMPDDGGYQLLASIPLGSGVLLGAILCAVLLALTVWLRKYRFEL